MPEKQHSQADDSDSDPVRMPKKRARFHKKKEASRFSRAQWEHQKKAEKKEQKYQETLKRKEEKEAALEQYRARKRAKYLNMCKKTPRGQPIMKYRIQQLLSEIEQKHGKKQP